MKMGRKDKSFIPEFLPDYPIHISLLPKEAQEVIGKPHPQTEPAMRMLKKQGFFFEGEVDLFDAGPTVASKLEDIRSIKENKKATVSEIREVKEEKTPLIVSNCSLQFRACFAHVEETKEGCAITEEVAKALLVKEGDPIRYVSAYPS
jgi:arginine N-succinyltransferase